MKLSERLEKMNLPGLRETGEMESKDITVKVKLFCPLLSWTWYLVEYDPENKEAYGYVDGDCPELGYISITELENTRFHLGQVVEIDKHWTPVPLSDVMDSVKSGTHL